MQLNRMRIYFEMLNENQRFYFIGANITLVLLVIMFSLSHKTMYFLDFGIGWMIVMDIYLYIEKYWIKN